MDSAPPLRRVWLASAASLLATVMAVSACTHLPSTNEQLMIDDIRGQRDSPALLPYGIPVPGKPGYVYSPYTLSAAVMNVKGKKPGQRVRDPVNRKVFLVP